MKNSIRIKDEHGFINYSFNYYTIVGKHLIRNYDAKVICIIDNY